MVRVVWTDLMICMCVCVCLRERERRKLNRHEEEDLSEHRSEQTQSADGAVISEQQWVRQSY